jgi:hypothetical protein
MLIIPFQNNPDRLFEVIRQYLDHIISRRDNPAVYVLAVPTYKGWAG